MIRNKGNITNESFSEATLGDDELRKFNHHVRRNRGELLFAKCWLLVEGETDVCVLSECADILGINLNHKGIRIVEYSQVGQNIFINVANSLGIDWFLLADGDKEGKNYIKSAKKILNGKVEKDHIYQLPYENMELLLCMNGYGSFYENGINEQKRHSIIAKTGTKEYWLQVLKSLKRNFSKPAAALEVISMMRKKGKTGVPLEIKNIIEKTIVLCGGNNDFH